MNCFSEAMPRIKEKKQFGSITAETAIVLPIVLIFMFLFVSFLQYVAVYFMVNRATYTTAEYMSYYACVYYENGVEKIEEEISDRIYKSLGDEGILLSDVLSEKTGNVVCSSIAHIILSNELNLYKDTYVGKLFEINNISLLGSDFFQDGNNFKLKVSCTSDLLFPLPFFDGKGYKISVNTGGKGWLRGNIYERKKNELSVWELDNISRGKKIEKHFGGNLPHNYPTIDIYEKETGRVTLIRSLDHTTDTYKKTENIKKTMETELSRIKNFNGTYDNNSVPSEYKIKGEDIKHKKILLIIPQNQLTVMQTQVLDDFSMECFINDVEFEYKMYQVSP